MKKIILVKILLGICTSCGHDFKPGKGTISVENKRAMDLIAKYDLGSALGSKQGEFLAKANETTRHAVVHPTHDSGTSSAYSSRLTLFEVLPPSEYYFQVFLESSKKNIIRIPQGNSVVTYEIPDLNGYKIEEANAIVKNIDQSLGFRGNSLGILTISTPHLSQCEDFELAYSDEWNREVTKKIECHVVTQEVVSTLSFGDPGGDNSISWAVTCHESGCKYSE